MGSDCLIIVERGVSEPDLMKSMLERQFRSYFTFLNTIPRCRDNVSTLGERDQAHLADYGLATQVSLTSIVLGTELHQAGISFDVIDDDDVVNKYSSLWERSLPEYEAIAVSTTYAVKQNTVQALLQRIGSVAPGTPILLGGQGLSAWRLGAPSPEYFLKLFPEATAFFFGESEGVFADLMKSLVNRTPIDGRTDLLVPCNGGWTGGMELREVAVSQTSLPDWSILDQVDFNDGFFRQYGHPSVVSLEEGRGCSFKCRFCSYPLYATFRRKTPERVVAELRSISDLGYETCAFSGAEFLNPLSQSRPVFESIVEAKLPIDIWAYARLDLVSRNPWIADLMAQARFGFIQFGMESGDRTVLKSMGKNYNPTEMAVGAKLMKEKGIEVYASLVLGYPGETEETLANTLAVLLDCDFEHVIFHVLDVVPGTRLWKLRDKYQLEIIGSDKGMRFWSHPSMRLTDMPKHVKKLFVKLSKNSNSHINNVTQNFANLFFRGKHSKEQLLFASGTLQEIIANEWEQKASAERDLNRLKLWDQLSLQIEQIPRKLLSGT